MESDLEKVVTTEKKLKLERLAHVLVTGLFIMMTAGLLIASVFSTTYMYNDMDLVYKWDFPWVHILLLLAVLGIGGWFKYKQYSFWNYMPGNRFLILYTILLTAAMFGWLYVTQLQLPELSDPSHCYDAALDLLKGEDYAWVTVRQYMNQYPFQNGIVLFMALLIRLFGDAAYMVFQVINIIFFILMNVAMCKTVRILFGEKVARYNYVLFPLYVPLTFYITYVYGTMIGLSLALLALMFFFQFRQKRRVGYMVASALCMTGAIIIKQNYMIFLAALLILIMLDSIRTRRVKGLLGILLVVLCLETGTMAVNKTVEHIIHAETPAGIPKMAWLAMGLQDTDDGAPGWFNAFNVYIYDRNHGDSAAITHVCLSDIKRSVIGFAKEPATLFLFFGEKIISEWNNPTFECFYIQYGRPSAIELSEPVDQTIHMDGSINKVLVAIFNIVHTWILFGAAAFVILNRKKLDIFQLTYAMIFVGGFIFYTFWEAKSQYTIVYFVLLIPYAMMGFNEVMNRVAGLIKKRAEQ